MKVSVSAPPDPPSPTLGRTGSSPRLRPGTAAWLIGAAYFVAHLPLLAPTLEDIDSLNFALGLREFDPSRHQPHPPGYPVYIGLGRLALAAARAAAPQLPRMTAEAWALSIWSAIGGALAVVFAWKLFAHVARRQPAAGWAA